MAKENKPAPKADKTAELEKRIEALESYLSRPYIPVPAPKEPKAES